MQMDLDARVMLLALTKNRWPGCKKDVALFIVANDQGAELGTICSQRVISEQTGISTSLVRRYLRELVDEGVLERHDGGGPRGHAFRFHDFARWRSRWFGAHARFDRDWPLKRESAVGQLLLLLRPENARKTRSAARPVAPLSTTAARSVASLYAPTGATRPATRKRCNRDRHVFTN